MTCRGRDGAVTYATSRDETPEPAVPGVARRRFLSVGGVLAGAGAIALPRRANRSAAPAAAVPVIGPVYPGDPRYATLCMGFNRRWAGSPAYIQIVASARQAVHAVQQACDAGLPVPVGGRGHRNQ